MKILVVLNPSAQDFEAEKLWKGIQHRFISLGEVTLVETQKNETVTRLEISNHLLKYHYDRVISIGGDGTIYTSINAIMDSKLETLPEFSIIPFGTANDVAKSLDLPVKDYSKLVDIASGNKLTSLDVASIKTEKSAAYWLNCVSLGLDADVVASRTKNRYLKGYLGYAAAFIEKSLGQKSLDVRIDVDGRILDGRFYNVIIMNAKIYAGMISMPGALGDDGLLNIYVFDRLKYAGKLMSTMVNGIDFFKLGVSDILDSITDNDRVIKGKKIKLRVAYPRQIQVDGEMFPKVSDIECEVVNQISVTV